MSQRHELPSHGPILGEMAANEAEAILAMLLESTPGAPSKTVHKNGLHGHLAKGKVDFGPQDPGSHGTLIFYDCYGSPGDGHQ